MMSLIFLFLQNASPIDDGINPFKLFKKTSHYRWCLNFFVSAKCIIYRWCY